MTEENDFNLRILALDLALANTGYCVFKVSTGNYSFTIPSFGLIETKAEIQMNLRLDFLLTKLKSVVYANDINYIISEEPTQAMFGSHGGAHARSLKLSCAFYYIKGYFDATDIYFRSILPSQWQPWIKKSIKDELDLNNAQEKKKYSKFLSMSNAMKILEYLKIKRKLLGKDEHLADAINIGFTAIKKISKNEWQLPSSIENNVQEHL